MNESEKPVTGGEPVKIEEALNIKKKKHIPDFVFYAGVLAATFILFTQVLMLVKVEGQSMESTFHNHDILMASRLDKDIQKGDIVVFRLENGKNLIKRVIATEGDTVDIDFVNGIVKINGAVLKEPYIKEFTHLNEGGFQYPVTVPENSLFVMGDNRNHSGDSRSPHIGFVSKDIVVGKVMFRLYNNVLLDNLSKKTSTTAQ